MEEKRPLISVIVPVYNAQEYLPICIESIFKQTYQNLEIILVNDGSSDASGEMCDEYAKKDPRVRVIHRQNGGVSSARNDALEIASGEYIGFVDSDDSIKPDMFETMLENLVESGSDISVCKFALCKNQAGDGEDETADAGELSVFTSKEAVSNMFIGNYFVGHACNKLFKASLLKDVRFDREIYVYEDMLFTTEAVLNAEKVCFTRRALYNYYMRPTSVLRRGFDERLLTAHDACVKIIDLLKARELYTEMKKYSDTLVILCNIVILRRLGNDKQTIKKYAPAIKKNVRKHYNRESLPYMSSNTKRNIFLLMISYRLYFLVLKILRSL